MAVLGYFDERFKDHDTGPHHPERPARLSAVTDGLRRFDLTEAMTPCAPRLATDDELTLVHDLAYVRAIDKFCADGGGDLDADTRVSANSAVIARLAAGAGLDAIERLQDGQADAAFMAVRPPGHHATPTRAMGFCIFNNAAVAAAALAASGQRVVIVDFDAHHGNGTSDAFYDRDDVLYVSWHQNRLYPGTGRVDEWGSGMGLGWTLNMPMPEGATGEHYRCSIEETVAPLIESHGSTWLIVSAGFDGHRQDPLTDLGLTSGDFAAITSDLLQLASPGHRLVFLEGGYDLKAIAESTAATVGAMVGEHIHPEPPSSGGPGEDALAVVEILRGRFLG